MDNNGIHDFAFLRAYSQFTVETYSGSPGASYTRTVIWAGWNDTTENEIAGSYNIGPFGSWTRYYPYALEVGDLIKKGGFDGLSFQNWGFQRMAFKSDRLGEFFNSGGHWYPEVTDHYLVVKFIDADENFHYGWIRCSVIDSGEVLIIKDYAYEAEPDEKIYAGDTANYVGVDELNTLVANVYSFNNTVFIYLGNEIYYKVDIHIYDLLGKEIYFNSTNKKYNAIELNEAKGIYIIQLISGEKEISKKLFLN